MKKPLAVFRYLLSVHILALIILSVFRFILYLTNIGQVANADSKAILLPIAMLRGLQFDNLIGCYIISLPLVILLLVSLSNKVPKPLIIGFNVFFIIAYTFIFGISVADIPYFSYFFTHLGGSIFNWLGFGGTMGMVFQETSYYIYFALFFGSIIFFGLAIFSFGKRLITSPTSNLIKKDYKYYIPFIIVIWGLCFVGLRGRVGRYPLRVSGAYFCDNSFYNQLGISPTFYLLKSTKNFKKKESKLENIANKEDAISYVQKALHIDFTDKEYPISRNVETEGIPLKRNVVIILLESMSSEYLKMEYGGKTLTPFIHELIDKSYYFNNFYSAGIHTNNGIASTLYGFPPIFEQTMMSVEVDLYTGLPVKLQDQGYQTSFFLTHDPQYDNMHAFLSENGFNKIYSQYDYPNHKVVNNFGVQDDYLYEYGIKKLNEFTKSQKPFFATFMTVSNHPPYIIPDKFKTTGNSDEERIIAFTDNSLKDFMQKASEQEWYKNTLFVILGDHGRVMGKQLYEMPLSYNHIPLILYSPLFDDAPKQFSQFGSQIDIFPTIMGLLNIPYQNNSLGVDLFKVKRPYTYFVSDNHLGCINEKYFYIYNPETKTDGLYDYVNENPNNIEKLYPAITDSMKQYATSMMITADYLIKNKLTRPSLIKSKLDEKN